MIRKLRAPSVSFALNLIGVVGCSSSPRQTTTVAAQQTYSNASVNRTYAVSLLGKNIDNASDTSAAVGTMKLDGAGNITSGTLQSGTFNSTCNYPLLGTYSVQSSGAGTATITLTSPGAGCGAGPFNLNLEVTGQGASFVFAAAGASLTGHGAVLSGTAIKQ